MGKTCYSAILSTTILKWSHLGMNPSPSNEKAASNRLMATTLKYLHHYLQCCFVRA
jgi:hypothetical protein